MDANLPRLALSVRQPWAWAIIHGGKNIENRDWREPNPGLRFRGPVAIHASTGMTRDEYEEARDFMAGIGVTCPAPADLARGGIIGRVIVQDAIRIRDVPGDPKWLSPWFFGPLGLVLREPLAANFIPAKGALGFFEWTAGDPAMTPQPARWMLPDEPQVQGSLL